VIKFIVLGCLLFGLLAQIFIVVFSHG
jgi:hypothetical protein